MTNETNAAPAAPLTAEQHREKCNEVGRQYFSVARLADAQTAINAALPHFNGAGLPVLFSFDTSQPLPAGYGMAMIPRVERQESGGNITVGIIVAAIPEPATIAASGPDGMRWCEQRITDALVNRIANTARDPSKPLPFEVRDFLTASDSLAYFKEVAPAYVKALKDAGLAHINARNFRDALEFAASATAHFPTVPAETWTALLARMEQNAANEGKDPGVLSHWRRTRDAAVPKSTTFDAAKLDAALAAFGTPADAGQAPADAAAAPQ